MSNVAIDGGQISAMVEKMRSAMAKVQLPESLLTLGVQSPEAVAATPKASFAQAMREQLDQVNALQQQAQDVGERFSLGDNSVHLSDVMLATQKSSIALQGTIQVRNKLVAAYQDIMNMPV